MYVSMKRGDIIKYIPTDQLSLPVIGMLLNIDSPSNAFWNEYSPKKITFIDFDGTKHTVELWSEKNIELLRT